MSTAISTDMPSPSPSPTNHDTLLAHPLDTYRISSLPGTISYIPSFLNPFQISSLQLTILSIPSHKWTHLSHRRLLSLPQPLTGLKRDTLLQSSLPEYLVDVIFEKFKTLRVFEDTTHGQANHCLVNEYEPGQGIMPHEDGAVYERVTATVSLGGHTVLDIYEKSGPEHEDGQGYERGQAGDGTDDVKAVQGRKPKWRILQEPGSLLVTRGKCYSDTLHGIAEVVEDVDLGADTIANWDMLGNQDAYASGSKKRELRISLTYRDVIKVAKIGGLGGLFGGRGRR